jgi:hypothetical protein
MNKYKSNDFVRLRRRPKWPSIRHRDGSRRRRPVKQEEEEALPSWGYTFSTARWLRVHAVRRAPLVGASASWACVPACGCRGAVWTRRRPRLPPALNHLRNLREELQSAYLLYMLWSTKKEIILLGNHVLVQIEMEMQWGSWAPTASSAWAHRRQLCPIMIAALVMASTKAHTASDCTSLRLPLPQLVQDRRKRDLHKIS